MQHFARGQEQQRLEHRMVQRVQQRRPGRECRQRRQVRPPEGQRQPQPHRHQPDILDGGAGEQGLGVLLEVRPQRPDHGGCRAERDQRRPQPEGLRRPHQVEHEARDDIERDLGHRPRHHRRDMAWRCRMRQRQPDMQRKQPRLGPRAGQHERQHRHRAPALGRGVPQRGEGDIPRTARHQPAGQHEHQPSEPREAEVDPRRPPVLRLRVVLRDQHPGGDGHRLEPQQQGEAVRRQQGQGHARDEERPGHQVARRHLPVRAAEGEERGAGHRQPDRQQEPGGQRIERQPRRPPGRPEGQVERRRPAEQPAHAPRHQQHTCCDAAAKADPRPHPGAGEHHRRRAERRQGTHQQGQDRQHGRRGNRVTTAG